MNALLQPSTFSGSLMLAIAFAVTSAGWLWARTKKGSWAETITRLMLPLMIGFGADGFLVLVLIVVKPDVEPFSARARAFEEFLIHLRICLGHVNGLPVRWLVAILAGLLAATWFCPRWKLVTRFSLLQQWVTGLLVAVTAMTTFTVFSSQPLQQRAKDNQAAMIVRYEVALRNEWDAVAQNVIAETIASSTRQWGEAEKQQFRTFMHRLDRVADHAHNWTTAGGVSLAARYRHMNVYFQQVVAETIAAHYTQDALNQPDVRDLLGHVLDFHEKTKTPLPKEQALLRIPGTVSELRAQRQVVEQQESRASDAKIKADQAKEVMKTTVAAVLVLPVPEFGGLGSYLNRLVDALTDMFADQLANWSRSMGRHIEANEAFQRLKTSDAVETMKKLLLPRSRSSSKMARAGGEDLSPVAASDMEREMENVAREKVPNELAKRPAEPVRPGSGWTRFVDRDGELHKLIEERIAQATHPERAADEK